MPLLAFEFIFNFFLDAQESPLLQYQSYQLALYIMVKENYVKGRKEVERHTSSSVIPTKLAFIVVYLILSVDPPTLMLVASTKILFISAHGRFSSSRRRKIMVSSGPAAARVAGIGGRVAREGVPALPGVEGSPSSVLPLSFLDFLLGVVVAEPVGLRPRLRGVTVALLSVGVFVALLASKADALVGMRVSFILFSLGAYLLWLCSYLCFMFQGPG